MILRRKREGSHWEQMYANQDVETMPWYHAGLDPDFVAALERYGIDGGEALDLCTGPGTQAMALAERGFSVTGTDIAAAAVEKACIRARAAGVEVTFQQNDILASRLEGSFDVVFDRGCFHLFPAGKRREYVPAVARLIKSGGYLLIKCFSYLETRPEGPYRIAPNEVESLFGSGFEILAIRHTTFSGHNEKPPPKALFCVLRKH